MDQSHVKLLENIKSNNKVRRCGDGNLFEHDDTGNISKNVSYVVIKSREPINTKYNYFELEIKSLAWNDDLQLCTGAISIGVGDIDYPLDALPGWTKYGVGYHSDDGKIFVCEGSGSQTSITCKEGDRMGCGIDFKESSKYVEIFFTKNGQHCCEPVKIKLPAKGFYPMIGILKEGDQVQYLGHWHREAPINLLTAIKDGETSKVQQWVQNPECRLLFPEFGVGGQGGISESLDFHGIPVLQKSKQYSIPESHEVVKAFHLACSKGLIDIVEILLNCELHDSDMDLLVEQDENGQTALLASAKNNKADVVTCILQRKKNAHLERNEDGYTAIMIAAENGCIEAYQVLWKHYSEHKASYIVNDDPQSYSEIPSELSQTWIDDVTDLAPQQTYDVTEPERAETIEMTENPRIRNQLEIPMDLSEPTKDENSQKNVVHLAAQSGQVGILNVMCELSKESYDGFLKQKDKDGNTPLHLACINGHEKVVDKFIKDKKVKADTMDLLMMNQRLETPAHLASKNGHSDIVNTFIQMSNETIMTETDENGQTMMHSAAASGHVEVLKVLIHHNDDVEAKDNDEETPLHLAARNGNVEAVKLMLQYCRKGGKKLVNLQNHDGHTYLDVAIHSGQRKVVEVSLSESQSLEGHEMFSEKSLVQLVRKMPDLAEAAMNRCITSDDWSEKYGSDQCEVTFDYALLERSRNKVLRTMVTHERVKLLKHPLVQGLIDTLWKRYKWLFYFSLLFHIVLVIFITSLALVLNNPTAEICQRLRIQVNESVVSSNLSVIDDVTNISNNSTGSDFENITINSDNNCGDLGNQSSQKMFAIAAAVIIIIISLFRLLLELIQFLKSLCNPYHRRYEYFLDFSNWLEVPLFIVAMIFAIAQFSSKCLCIHDWQWNVGIISLVLVWSSLVVYLRKLDILDTGIYVLMLEILIIRFVKVIILTALLVIMFALAFHMTLAQLEDPRFIVSPFASPLNSIWKTMTMMTGELDYESIFRQASEGSEDPIPALPFPVIAYLLWIVFLIMMPILLSNLLVGLAVDDIKDILDSAEMRRIESKIDLIISFDNDVLRFLILLCCCLPCLFWCDDKSGSLTEYVFERRKVGKETVKPFYKNKFKTLFQERKKFKSPQCLSAIINPDTIMKESLEERIDKIQEMQREMKELILSSMKSQSDRSTTK